MRLLFISSLYPPPAIGGYERICHDVATELEKRGHQMAVLTSGFRAGTTTGARSGVERTLKLRSNFGLSETGPTPWVAANRFELEWHNARTVRRFIGEARPDAVMVWQGDQLGRAFLGAAQEGATVVCYLQDSWLATLLRSQAVSAPKRVARTLYRTGLDLAGLPVPAPCADLVFVSSSLESLYAHTGVTAARTTVVRNGLEASIFPRQAQHILEPRTDEPPRVLFAGRITPEKGVTTLVRAVHRVRLMAGLEETRLSMLGSIQDEAFGRDLSRMVEELGLASAIDFLPPRPRANMSAAYAAHDVLAFPSEWQEPFGLTLLEAMACGLPVVSTLRGGPSEIVRDGQNALAFEAGDSDELARKLAWMLTHPYQAAALGAAASDEVHARFTLDAQVTAIEALLEEVVHRLPRTRTSEHAEEAADCRTST
jgi:glycosyltransferase involved in cell wall biosynthesis